MRPRVLVFINHYLGCLGFFFFFTIGPFFRFHAALPEKSEGYIQVFLDGGLNQQRMGVCTKKFHEHLIRCLEVTRDHG